MVILARVLSVSIVWGSCMCYAAEPVEERVAAVAWGEAVAGVQMSASVERGKRTVWQPVILRLILRNVSDQSVSYVVTGDRDFSFTVLDKDGKEVPLTRYGSMMKKSSFFMHITMELAPGAEAKWVFGVDRFCDMTIAGTYSIRVSRAVWNRDKKSTARVSSNIVQLVVEDANVPQATPEAAPE